MKKLFKKLVLFSIASVILANLSMMNVAEANTDCATVIAAVSGKGDCIADNETRLTTIVEEPFMLGKEAKKLGTGADFTVEPCVRISGICKKDKNASIETIPSQLKKVVDGAYTCPASTAPESPDGIGTTYYCKEVLVIFSKGGSTMIMGFISMIYKWGASIVGLIAVLVIVISGIQISASGGDSSAIDGAKGRILKSLSGLAVLFLSGIILYTINPNFFVAQ